MTASRLVLACSALLAVALAGCTGEPPRDLTCQADANGNHLAWQPSENATSYQIWRMDNSTTDMNESIPLPIALTNETSYDDTNVTKGHEYIYYVSAENETDMSEPAMCSVTSVPFFGSPMAWALALVGTGAAVALIVWRRR